MGKPVPEVDTNIAALNQSYLKPSTPFSPLTPFIQFAEAIGFIGPPDRYQAAKKTLEEKRAEAATAQAAAEKAALEKAGSDILIQTKIEQDASGKKQVSGTLLGGNPSPAPTTVDKSEDAKKKPEPKKNDDKKKPDKKPPSQ